MSENYTRTRRKYTYDDKIKILKELDLSGNNVSVFSKKVNIPVKTLQNWKQNKELIFATEKKDLSKKKLMRVANHY